MGQLAKLFELQQLERQVASVEKEMQESNESTRKQEAENAVSLHEKQMARAERALAVRHKQLRAMEDQLATLEDEVEQIEKRLFGGEVTNPKELSSLQDNLNKNKQSQQQLEETVLEEMSQLDSYNEKMESARRRTRKLEKVLHDATLVWAEAQKGRKLKVATLKEECRDLRQAIDASYIAQYDELRKRLGFRVVAKVNERTCTGCHMTLPTNMKVAEGGRCPNCDRILWWD